MAVNGDPMCRPDRSSVDIVPPADEDHFMHDMTADMDATGDGTGELDVMEESNVQVNIDLRAEVNSKAPPAVQQQELPPANSDLTRERRLTGLEQRVDLLEQGNTALNSQLEATSASLCVTDEIMHSGVFTSLSHQSHNQQVAGKSTHPSNSASAIMGVAGRMVSVEQQRQANILARQDYYSILGETQGSVLMLTQPIPPSPTANVLLPAASTDQMVTTTLSWASAPPGVAITMSLSSLGRSSSFPGAPAGTNVYCAGIWKCVTKVKITFMVTHSNVRNSKRTRDAMMLNGRTDSEGLGFSSCAAPLTRIGVRRKSEDVQRTSKGVGNFGRTFRTGASNFRMSAGKFRRNFRKLQ
ncbi:hypothetical protein C8R48DRAFT_672614 [Suillus tomentosus]|nr:hypothetical protein C8R48DRAFT_672614 [Suillus tomentosus]